MDRDCDACRQTFAAKRSTARYCSAKCRKRAHRALWRAPSAPSASPGVSGAVRAELGRLGAEGSFHGQLALVLAGAMDSPNVTGSGLVALSKELTRIIEGLRAAAPRKGDPLDELMRRRDAKRGQYV